MTLKEMQARLQITVYTCAVLALGGPCSGQWAVPSASSVMTSHRAGSKAADQASINGQGRKLAIVTSSPEKPVITIHGLCNQSVKSHLGSCRTVVTGAEFERIIGTAEPKMSAKAQREFAEKYADALIMAHKAEQMGLDQGMNFEEEMKLARIQILSKELKKIFEKQASQISEQEVKSYYSDHREDFEQVELERIHVPRYVDGHNGHILLNDPEAQKQLQVTELAMKEAADKFRERAIAGDDFDSLQKEAFETAGIKTSASSAMGKIRRASLPQSQRWVVELNTGEISPVIADSNGFTIYRVKAKGMLSLDQVRDEIKGILQADHFRRAMQSIEESATTILDESYFRKSFHE